MHTARPKDLRFFNGTAVVSGGRGINNGEREGERRLLKAPSPEQLRVAELNVPGCAGQPESWESELLLLDVLLSIQS